MVKALFRWATKKGYLARNPAADSDVLKRRKHAQRQRRLETGEEAQLLDARWHALTTADYRGARDRMPARANSWRLMWRDVNLDRREITIRPRRTKTRTGRVIPISARLAGVLEMAQDRPDEGQDFEPDDFVFGDAVGGQVKDIKQGVGDVPC